MRDEIRRCCLQRGIRAGLPWARFSFPATFSGFGGHFPSRPILPAVCMLLTAAVVMEDWHRSAVRVLEVQSARFRVPVAPGEVLSVECVAREETGEGSVARLTLDNAGRANVAVCVFCYATGGLPS